MQSARVFHDSIKGHWQLSLPDIRRCPFAKQFCRCGAGRLRTARGGCQAQHGEVWFAAQIAHLLAEATAA